MAGDRSARGLTQVGLPKKDDREEAATGHCHSHSQDAQATADSGKTPPPRSFQNG